MGVFSVAAIFSELGNGANFALVPHCNAFNNVSFYSSPFLPPIIFILRENDLWMMDIIIRSIRTHPNITKQR
jgi:hypothetical protein